MKILILEWGAYTQPDITACFEKHHVVYEIINYRFKDKNKDPAFSCFFSQCLDINSFDAVFSVNYFPLIAQICYEHNLKYLSWSYDNPLNVRNIEETIGLPTNFVFLFDKIQMEKYRNKGFYNVFHLPLAVNIDRLDKIEITKEELAYYKAQVSFVGNLYQSSLDDYMSAMEEYCKGYIEAICAVQLKLYGCYLIDEMLIDDFLLRINSHYRSLNPETKFQLTKEALSYACAAQVTRKERLLLLGLLAAHHQVKLYSPEQNQVLKNVQYMGSCNYLEQMPKVFKASNINLNITLKCNQAGMPLRALDIMGCGGFLLSNYQEELAENFENEKELVLYESIEDAYEKADFYLRRPELRKSIAGRGYQKVKEQFCYEKQLLTLFKIAGMI